MKYYVSSIVMAMVSPGKFWIGFTYSGGVQVQNLGVSLRPSLRVSSVAGVHIPGFEVPGQMFLLI